MSHWCLVIEKNLDSLPFASDKDAYELKQVKNIKQLSEQTIHPILIFVNFPNFFDVSHGFLSFLFQGWNIFPSKKVHVIQFL